MILFSNRVRFYLCSHPVDMRNGREGLARIIREALGHDPLDYNEASFSIRGITGRFGYFTMM